MAAYTKDRLDIVTIDANRESYIEEKDHKHTILSLKEEYQDLMDDVCRILAVEEKQVFIFLSKSYRGVE